MYLLLKIVKLSQIMLEHTPFDLFHRRTLLTDKFLHNRTVRSEEKISLRSGRCHIPAEMKGTFGCLIHPSEEKKKVSLYHGAIYALTQI